MTDAANSDNQEHARDARLVAIETRQKLRDEHVDRRFDAMGAEFAGLDRRVSNQIGELNIRIDAGFQALTAELKSDRNQAELRVAKLYEDWRGEKDSESKRPPSVKVSMLLGMMGVVFPTVTLVGGVIMLVIQPIKERLEDHIANGPHWNGESRVALLEERVQRNELHTTDVSNLHQKNLEKLNDLSLVAAEQRGKMEALDAYRKEQIDNIRKDLMNTQRGSDPR